MEDLSEALLKLRDLIARIDALDLRDVKLAVDRPGTIVIDARRSLSEGRPDVLGKLLNRALVGEAAPPRDIWVIVGSMLWGFGRSCRSAGEHTAKQQGLRGGRVAVTSI